MIQQTIDFTKPKITEELKSKIPLLIETLKTAGTIKGRDLARQIGVHERLLRLMVNYARLSTAPEIMSGAWGYRFETDKNKLLASLKRHEAHAYSELEVIRHQKQLIGRN